MASFGVFSALDDALFPRLCAACGGVLSSGEKAICPICRMSLPYFDNSSLTDNKITALLRRSLPLSYAASLLDFQKGGPVQRIIHRLKYHKQLEIGAVLGQWLGEELKNTSLTHCDCVIPVPLHRKKLKKRGYKQVSGFAQALASRLGLGVHEDILFRVYDGETQTKKSRFTRWLNVKEVFTVFDDAAVSGKKVLLVDDVITTGATLNACAQALLRAQGVQISIAVMAVAQ